MSRLLCEQSPACSHCHQLLDPAYSLNIIVDIALQTDEPVAAGKGKKGSKDEGKGKKKK